jgi:hypothetical protein
MAAKKTPRGATLVKKAIEASASQITSPEPVPAGILKKLRMPDDEKLPAGLKTFLGHDASWLGWEFDDEEPEFEPMAFEEVVAQEFGDDAVSTFGEAVEMFEGDCVLFEGPVNEGDVKAFLYVGSPDEQGEYPVVELSLGDAPRVFGFLPFDAWVAQRFGVLAAGDAEPLAKALAEANGDGRTDFAPQHRDIAASKDDDEDEDEDEGEG